MTGLLQAVAYEARNHVFFAAEPGIHHDSRAALTLPPVPPAVREQPTGSDQLTRSVGELMPRSGGGE